MTDRNLKAHAAMFGANLIFGLNTPITKTIFSAHSLSPLSLSFLRMIGAATLFWIASFFLPKEKVSKKDLFRLFLAALFGIVLNQFPFLIGLSKTSPVDASIVVTTVPIMTMIIAAIYLKEPITGKKAGGVALGLTGALILIVSNNYHIDMAAPNFITPISASASSASGSSLFGNLLCLLSATSFAFYLTVFKPLIMKYKPVTLMKWMFLFASITSLPFCYTELMETSFQEMPFDVYLRIIYVVFFATFVSYILIPIGQQSLRPTIVSMYNYLQPLVSSLVAVALGISVFGLEKGVAALLIFTGVYVVTTSKSRADLLKEQGKG